MALAAKPHAALTRIQVGEQRALLIARWCAYVGLAALVHRAVACVPRGLGPDMLAARRAQKEWVHRNLFPVLPHENIWDGGDADDLDSDWESDHEPSDEQVAWMERG